MKSLFLLVFMLLATVSQAQNLNVAKILQKADEKIEALHSLSYWIDSEIKYLSNEDTTRRKAICHLLSVPSDSMNAYHNVIDLSFPRQQVYNGENILNIDMRDSSSLVLNTELYGYSYIKGNYISELIRYNLFIDNFFSKKLTDSTLIESQLSEVDFRNVSTYAILFTYKDGGSLSNVRSTYYFRKKDFFPIGFENSLKFQNMIQYKSYYLSNIGFNSLENDKTFDLDYNIIHRSKVRNYIPKTTEPLLSEGAEAPSIHRKTLDDLDFKLENYRGKIVILDFWYRSCYPCIKALPDLQKLSTSFDKDEVVVVGVNGFDSKASIIPFLDKRNISYTNIYDAKTVNMDYKINAYPTLYIIDQEGKISASHEGWGENFYEEIEGEIKQLLK